MTFVFWFTNQNQFSKYLDSLISSQELHNHLVDSPPKSVSFSALMLLVVIIPICGERKKSWRKNIQVCIKIVLTSEFCKITVILTLMEVTHTEEFENKYHDIFDVTIRGTDIAFFHDMSLLTFKCNLAHINSWYQSKVVPDF